MCQSMSEPMESSVFRSPISFDQTTVLLAYTSLDRLLDGLGATQRWGVLETKRLPEVQEQTNFDKIEIDRYIEPDARERKAQ